MKKTNNIEFKISLRTIKRRISALKIQMQETILEEKTLEMHMSLMDETLTNKEVREEASLKKKILKEKAAIEEMLEKYRILYYIKEGKKSEKEIAVHLGVSIKFINTTIAGFNKTKGLYIITPPKKKQRLRNKAYLTYKEEKQFLKSFVKANNYNYKKIRNLIELHVAYEVKIGRKVHRSTVYRLLKKHHWGKTKSGKIIHWQWYRGEYPPYDPLDI